jgi:sulfide:quinone oxidoreductase
VDKHTLQHKTYPNIFGLGDINNIPTTKTFWAAFNQVHVVRHNVCRNLFGLSPNASYDGFTKAYIDIGSHEGMNISHYYDFKGNNTFDHFHTAILGTLQAKLRHY